MVAFALLHQALDIINRVLPTGQHMQWEMPALVNYISTAPVLTQHASLQPHCNSQQAKCRADPTTGTLFYSMFSQRPLAVNAFKAFPMLAGPAIDV